jgi:hypothetical protein
VLVALGSVVRVVHAVGALVARAVAVRVTFGAAGLAPDGKQEAAREKEQQHGNWSCHTLSRKKKLVTEIEKEEKQQIQDSVFVYPLPRQIIAIVVCPFSARKREKTQRFVKPHTHSLSPLFSQRQNKRVLLLSLKCDAAKKKKIDCWNFDFASLVESLDACSNS